RNRRTALWYEPRILATLADAKLAAGDRSGARALLSEARELVDRGRGWRLGAFDVALARVRLLASEPAVDRTAIESALDARDALATELSAEAVRPIAALERARLATYLSDRSRVELDYPSPGRRGEPCRPGDVRPRLDVPLTAE